MPISTKNAPTGNNSGGGFTNKSLQPGNVKCKVHSIKLEKAKYVTERDEYNILLSLEGEPLPAPFVGFPVVFGDNNGERFKGQQATVRALQYNTYDGETPNGYTQSVENSVLGFLNDFVKETGCMDYWLSIDNKFDTIQEIIQDMDKAKPFANVWMTFCLGARSYINKAGYNSFDLHIVRADKGSKSFCADASQVMKFDKDKHIIKPKVKDGATTKKSETPITDSMQKEGNVTQQAKVAAPNTQNNSDFLKEIAEVGEKAEEAPWEETNDIVTEDNSESLPFSLD